MLPATKRIVILGGGTNTYISNHLALSAPAYGTTAVQLEEIFKNHPENKMDVDLILTKMADPSIYTNPNAPDTPEDIEAIVDTLVADPTVRAIIFNVAMVDYKPTSLYKERIGLQNYGDGDWITVKDTFGKYDGRLSTSENPELILELTVQEKIIQKIRKERKDILLVGFKTTCGATKEEQFQKGLKLCKDASANIVFVNDVDKDRIERLKLHLKAKEDTELRHTINGVRIEIDSEGAIQKELWKEAKIENFKAIETLQNNGLVTPEESSYWYDTREDALEALAQMVLDRTHLHFTRSTVVDSETVSWNIRQAPPTVYATPPTLPSEMYAGKRVPNPLIPETFRTVFDWVRDQGAYKSGPTGATVGHFGIKLGPNEFLTSKRKTNFNNIEKVGLVRVITDDPDNVFGYKHFFRPDFGDDFNEYLDFIEYVLKYFDVQELRDEWLGVYGEYWDLLKIFPELDFHTHEAYRQASERLQGNVYPDKVIAFGAKPSVGGQSQRSLFDTFPELDCIVHFHCPLKVSSRSLFNTTPQFSFECGSKECIASNITGFKEYKVSETHSIWAGHMDYHGPNIVFSKDIDPQLVINFIDQHWDLSRKTDGLSEENK